MRLGEEKAYINSGIQEKLIKEDTVALGKRCHRHPVKDDPDDLHCTFMPQLFVPLGAPKDPHAVVDPLMFRPI